MAARLTDRQKKMIIADRANEMSIRKLAEKYHVTTTTIQRVLKNNTELAQMVTQKKQQNTADMIEYMNSRKEQAKGIIDEYLKQLKDPEKIDKATLLQIATAMGIVIDKFMDNTKSSEDTGSVVIVNNIPRG